jgi:flagellar biosynthesis protein FliP
MTTPYLSVILSLIFLTGFVKIATVFSALKEGLGLKGFGFSVALAGLAIALSIVAVEPKLQKIGGVDGFLSGQPLAELEPIFRPDLEAAIKPQIELKVFPVKKAVESKDVVSQDEKATTRSFSQVIVLFLISELSRAFEVALALLIPFVVIDLVVANILVMLTVVQLKSHVVALPLKILLFIAVDGWSLISRNLLSF